MYALWFGTGGHDVHRGLVYAFWRRNLVEIQKRPWIYLITGRPITKKNSGRYVGTRGGRSRLLPSKQFEAYEEAALWQLRCQARPDIPLACPVNLRVEYYMPNRKGWPDLMGLIQATADILQDAEILADDGYIARLTGCQIAGIDKVNPRAEIIVMPLDPDQSVLYELHPDFIRGRK